MNLCSCVHIAHSVAASQRTQDLQRKQKYRILMEQFARKSAEASLPSFGNKAVVEEESQWKVLYFTLAAKSVRRKFITNGTEDTV